MKSVEYFMRNSLLKYSVMSVKANNLHENAEYFIRLLNFSPSFASIKVLAAKYENRVTVQCFLAIPINFSQFNDRVFIL